MSSERDVSERDHLAARMFQALEGASTEFAEGDSEAPNIHLRGLVIISDWEDVATGGEWFHLIHAKGSDGRDTLTPWQAKGLLHEAIDMLNLSRQAQQRD